jgi:predicted RNA binding protein YcfA (HicA-like mRNA interferase family)
MSKNPRLTGAELIAALGLAGFASARIRGSHHFLRHVDGRHTVLPVHSGETIGPGLLSKILRDCQMSGDELLQLMKRR